MSRTFDLNTPPVLAKVCGMSSRFVQVTVVPTVTVGPKAKLLIFTSAVPAACSALAWNVDEADINNVIAINTTAA